MSVLTRNNVRVLGSGKQDIVFAHGFGCDQNVWAGMTAAFKEDFRLILFDYVGAGASDLRAYDPDRYSTLGGYAQDMIEVAEALKISGAILIGHSVSSMIGVIAANQQPQLFNKLIFLGPSPCYINEEGYHGGFSREDLEGLLAMMDENYLGWSKALAPQIMGNSDRPALGESLTNSFCATDPEIAKQFARVTFLSDVRDELPKLKIPSLTLQCSADIVAPIEVGRYINENTPGNELVILKATGHCSHLSAPEETVSAIRAFIN
ncbi:MAG: alpha/beta hydrolase [Bacteroidota bacterium]|nr:alpha/beta hydrolase [Bacteroidota bacterium]